MRGNESRQEIIAKNISDPALRKDIDFIFYLTRNPDGTYQVKKLRHA